MMNDPACRRIHESNALILKNLESMITGRVWLGNQIIKEKLVQKYPILIKIVQVILVKTLYEGHNFLAQRLTACQVKQQNWYAIT